MSFYPVRWLSVFPNHQMTLPQTFCQHVGFRNQAECILNQSHLILRPLDVSSLTQEVQILNDLIQAGYGGQFLLDSFRRALGLPVEDRPPVPPQDLLFDDVSALPNHSLCLLYTSIHTVYQYTALTGIIEPGNQIHQRRLPRSCTANDSDGLSSMYRKVQIG